MTVNETKPMNLASLISPQRIWVVKDKTSKKELIETMVRSLCAGDPQLDPAYVAAQILAREKGVSTTLDTGLALPHARLEELTDFKASLAVLAKPISDKSGASVRVMFLFLTPAKPEFFQPHLQLLASLAKTFTPTFIDEITKLSTPAEIASRFLA